MGVPPSRAIILFLLYPVYYEIQYFVLNDDVGTSKTMALASSRIGYLLYGSTQGIGFLSCLTSLEQKIVNFSIVFFKFCMNEVLFQFQQSPKTLKVYNKVRVAFDLCKDTKLV